MNNEITCTITREIAVLSQNSNSWQLELNEVAWNGNPAKLEIRRWAPEHAKSRRGVTFTEKEARNLYQALKEELGE